MSKISVPTEFISPAASFLGHPFALSSRGLFSVCPFLCLFSVMSNSLPPHIALGPHPNGLILMSSPLIGPVSK